MPSRFESNYSIALMMFLMIFSMAVMAHPLAKSLPLLTHCDPCSTSNPYLFYCDGHAGESLTGNNGCGGNCTLYLQGERTNCNSDTMGKICARGTNCIETGSGMEFIVCDGSLAYCNGMNKFHPGMNAEGRLVWNTVGTAFIYVYCTGKCRQYTEPADRKRGELGEDNA